MAKQLVLLRAHKETLVNMLNGHETFVKEGVLRDLEQAGLAVPGSRTLTQAGREQALILKQKISSV